ncbi:tetratricopeptide repeat protein [bacterium]|nr:tetratricopeptide repeat protein [bacterium]NIN92233.1 tetratricopeptide repeat protein [bacterium]NIO18375.1 tetratricopeptide repeat protein [bacterium]NIO73354.1 tetratricopeptide repeat protein [bacterium]
MNKLIRMIIRIILVGAISVCVQGTCRADFEDLGVGARPIGMGNAYTALADDVNAIYYNPAGLAQLDECQFTSGYGKLYWGLDDGSNLGSGFIGYAHPLYHWGTLGAGWVNFGLQGLYRENSFIFSYGNRIRTRLLAGLNLKLLHKKYGKTTYTENALIDGGPGVTGERDPVFSEGYSKTGFSTDLGFLYKFNREYSLGLSLIDINQPNMDLKDNKSKVPIGVKSGFLYNSDFLTFAFDTTFRNGDVNVHSGVEKWFANRTFAVRAGLGVGSRSFSNLALGASYTKYLFQFDYAFLYPLSGIRDTYGSHRISLTLRFAPEKEEKKKAREERLAKIAAEKAAREELAKIKEKEAKLIEERRKIELARNYYREAIEVYRNGLYSEALGKLRFAVELDPKRPEIQDLFKKLSSIVDVISKETGLEREAELIRSGVSYYIEDKPRKAITTLQYAFEHAPKNKEIPRLLNVLKREYPAIAEQEKISAGMTLVEQKMYRALNYLYEDRSDLAIVECQEVLELEPNNTLALSRLGSAYYVIGQKEKAKELWLKVLEIEPENKEVLESLRKEGIIPPKKKPKAPSRREEMKKEFEKSQRYYRRVENNLDIDGKIELLQSIIDKFKPSRMDVSGLERELRELKKEKEKEKIKAQQEKKETKAPKPALPPEVKVPSEEKVISTREKMEQKFSEALSDYKKGDYNGAIAKWEEVVKVRSDDAELKELMEKAKARIAKTKEKKIKEMKKHYTKAVAYYKKRRWEDAITELEEVLKLEPEHKQSETLIKRIEEKIWLTAQEERKKKMDEYYNAGLTYFQNGEYEKAIAQFERVLNLEPIHLQAQRLIKEAKEKAKK